MENNWKNINEERPKDGERVITWNNKFKEVRIQVFNEEHECWDTEDGDDFEFKLDDQIIKYWMNIPNKPE